MPRISDRNVFLNRLTELSGTEGRFISNEALRMRLAWEKPKYQGVHSILKQEGLISIKRGRGGSLAPVRASKADKLLLFVSYSHIDKTLKEQLVLHLLPLEREGLIEVWADQQILAGDSWDSEITKKISKADIVIALVSIDFINSKYCYDVELFKALAREVEGESKVIPVILRSCLWEKSPLGSRKALPTDGKAVTRWDDVDHALTVVASGIRDAAIALLENG